MLQYKHVINAARSRGLCARAPTTPFRSTVREAGREPGVSTHCSRLRTMEIYVRQHSVRANIGLKASVNQCTSGQRTEWRPRMRVTDADKHNANTAKCNALFRNLHQEERFLFLKILKFFLAAFFDTETTQNAVAIPTLVNHVPSPEFDRVVKVFPVHCFLHSLGLQREHHG